jgi:hypothetical protein
MTEQHINDPITTTAKKLREKISSSSRSLGWQVASVRAQVYTLIASTPCSGKLLTRPAT